MTTSSNPPPRPGDIIRCRRPLVAFYPEGHPRRNTHHGLLISRGTRLVYVGPDPRPGVHLARTPTTPGGQTWEVFFALDHLLHEP